MGRSRYLLRRVIQGAVTILAIILLNFLLIRAAPGDPALAIAGEAGAADEQYLAKLREDFGLDRPLHEQFVIYVKGFITLDFGYSYKHGQPVVKLIGERIGATVLLAVAAFTLSVLFGVILGTLAALRVGTWADSAVTVVSLAFYAMPLFWFALMSILLFSVVLGWLPAVGFETVGANYTGIAHVLDVAHHLVLPTLTLSLFYMAVYARLTRSSVLEVARQEYVTTARAKGIDEGRIVRAHILRNAILPVVSMGGFLAGQLMGGTVVIETIFAWPGIGRLAFEAALGRDYTLLLGIFFLTSTIVVVFNLITDFIYALVDPRIEVGQ